jgi:hypothetical protein
MFCYSDKSCTGSLQDIPAIFKADPLMAKAKLAEHYERMTMYPQSYGTRCDGILP